MGSIGNNCGGFDDGLWLFAILALMGWGNGGWGGGNATRVGESYATHGDIDRAVNLNSLQRGQADIEGVVRSTTADTIGAIKDGNYDLLGEIRDIMSSVSLGFSSLRECCCDLKSMIMENRYLSERNTNTITNAIHAEGEATRNLINANEMARIRDELAVSREKNNRFEQSQYMLGQMGRWYSNPPCYGPCGQQCCNN